MTDLPPPPPPLEPPAAASLSESALPEPQPTDPPRDPQDSEVPDIEEVVLSYCQDTATSKAGQEELEELLAANARLSRENALCKTQIRKLSDENGNLSAKLDKLDKFSGSLKEKMESMKVIEKEREKTIRTLQLEKNTAQASLEAKDGLYEEARGQVLTSLHPGAAAESRPGEQR